MKVVNIFSSKGITIGAVLIALVVINLFLGPAARVEAATPDHEDLVQIFAADVYVIEGGSYVNPTFDTPPDRLLYNVAGAGLGLTWGEWQHANATATARGSGGAKNPRTDIRIHVSGLIPNGVYSVFYGTFGPDSENPLCRGTERTLALTAFNSDAQVPDASSFIADANGAADYHARLDGAVLTASQVYYHIIYHFDGRTYDPLPNRGEYFTQGNDCRSSFGDDAMRQLTIYQKG